MKPFKDNDVASFGVMAIIVPMIIVVVLTGVSAGMGESTDGTFDSSLNVPLTYDNMTKVQRAEYLSSLHGGIPVENWGLNGYGLEMPWLTDRTYPDGTVITNNAYNRFVNGEADNVDYMNLVLSCFTVNPPLLEDLGFAGILIRIILILSIALGLLDLIWIG